MCPRITARPRVRSFRPPGSRRRIQTKTLDPLPVRRRIVARKGRELVPAPRPFQGMLRDSPQLGVRDLAELAPRSSPPSPRVPKDPASASRSSRHRPRAGGSDGRRGIKPPWTSTRTRTRKRKRFRQSVRCPCRPRSESRGSTPARAASLRRRSSARSSWRRRLGFERQIARMKRLIVAKSVLAEVRHCSGTPTKPLRGGRALPPWAPSPRPEPGSPLVPLQAARLTASGLGQCPSCLKLLFYRSKILEIRSLIVDWSPAASITSVRSSLAA